MKKTNKVSIVGAGSVGATAAYALSLSGIVQDLVIVDVNKEKALGEVLDLRHGSAFIKPMNITTGDYEATKDSDIVVVTAGAPQKPGETRIDLVNKNVSIFKSIIPEVAKYSPDAILLIVANPVDILSYVAYKLSGFPQERVIGSGTVLDSSRLKYEISEELNVDPRSIDAYIMGEHGDTEFPAWSLTNVEGIKLEKFAEEIGIDFNSEMKDKIHEAVKMGAYEVINRKGATYYAIGLSIKRIVEAILGDENAVLPVSVLVDNYYGVEDVYIGVPSIVNADGIKKILKVDLDEKEVEQFKSSGFALKKVLEDSFLG